MSFSEGDLLRWLRARVPAGPGVRVGLGDDAAVLEPPQGLIVGSTDLVVEDVHFSRAQASWRDVGRKAVARGLSDLAAMGARPWTVMCSVAVPGDVDEGAARSLFEGILEICRQEESHLVGGDLSRSPHGLTVDVTVLGCLEGRAPLLRSGARVGDRLLVSGVLGGSAEGHHLTFQPRWREGRVLGALEGVHAAIDLSDGLAQDLFRLAGESGVGARLERTRIPRRTRADGTSVAVEAALHDGEDFELLVAVDPAVVDSILDHPHLRHLRWTDIGEVVPAGPVVLVDDHDRVTELARGGYEHRFGT